ncbi:hypothetical protein ACP70R_020742 [Stipagrostis hirtigluma subsp. patula]
MSSLARTFSSVGASIGRRATTFSNVGVVMTRISSMGHELHGFLSAYGREAGYILHVAEFIGRLGIFLGRCSHLLRHYSREMDNISAAVDRNHQSGLHSAANPAILATANQGIGAPDSSVNDVEENINSDSKNDNEQINQITAGPIVTSPLPSQLLGPSENGNRGAFDESSCSGLKKPCTVNVIKKMVSSIDDVAVLEKEGRAKSDSAILIDVDANASLGPVRFL